MMLHNGSKSTIKSKNICMNGNFVSGNLKQIMNLDFNKAMNSTTLKLCEILLKRKKPVKRLIIQSEKKHKNMNKQKGILNPIKTCRNFFATCKITIPSYKK